MYHPVARVSKCMQVVVAMCSGGGARGDDGESAPCFCIDII